MLRPALTALLLSTTPALADVPRVAADIAPVHSLVAQVMGDLGQPDLLVRPGASPHGYSLRPSEARALDQAELVVILGEQLTPWLSGPLETLAADAQQRSLMGVEGTTLLANRTGATFDTHDHDHGHDHDKDDGHDDHAHDHDKDHDHDDHAHDHDKDHDHDETAHMHDHEGDDPHAWLDPQNAALWLDVIAGDLAALDPENAAIYRANAAAARERLAALQGEIAAMLPAEPGGFIVFHDAYQYFEARFGLAAAGAISLSDATAPSAGRLADLRDRIADLNVSCVFTEPQFDPGIIAALDIEGLGTASLDPMGSVFAPGPDHYDQTLRAMGAAFADCLGT